MRKLMAQDRDTLTWGPPQASGESLLQHLKHIHILLLFLFLFLSLPWCSPGCFSHIFSSLSCSILPILKYVFPEVPPCWLRSSAVSCGGSIRASWNGPCLPRHTRAPAPATRIHARFFFLRNPVSSTKYCYQERRVPFQKFKMVYFKKA